MEAWSALFRWKCSIDGGFLGLLSKVTGAQSDTKFPYSLKNKPDDSEGDVFHFVRVERRRNTLD